MVQGPVFVADFQKDMEMVESIIQRSYSGRFIDPHTDKHPARPILGPERSLGSVIKLLTPAPAYNEDFNNWLRSLPAHIKDCLLYTSRCV